MTLGKLLNHITKSYPNKLLFAADFWSRYEIVYGKEKEENERTDDDFDDKDENEEQLKKLPKYTLKVE